MASSLTAYPEYTVQVKRVSIYLIIFTFLKERYSV